MPQLSIAVILLSILAFAVGFIFGTVLTSEDKYLIPRTNYDKFVDVNREELIEYIAHNYCINPVTYSHEQMSCIHCPFGTEHENVEHCIDKTDEWLRLPYLR